MGNLSASLTDRALGVYSRLSETATLDYDQLNEALCTRYNFTLISLNNFTDGGCRFRDTKSGTYESLEQFIVRLRNYLHKWIEMSKTEICL